LTVYFGIYRRCPDFPRKNVDVLFLYQVECEKIQLGGKADHADREVQARADRDDAAQIVVSIANEKAPRKPVRKPRSGADLLTLTERVRRSEGGRGETTEGTGEGARDWD
jgi:hypothetical protein